MIDAVLQTIDIKSANDFRSTCMCSCSNHTHYPVSILHKSIAGRYRPVRVADGPITACYRFSKRMLAGYTCITIGTRQNNNLENNASSAIDKVHVR